MSPSPTTVTSKIQSFRQGVSQSLKSALTAGLRSCDDATDVFAAGNELVVGGKKRVTAWGSELVLTPGQTASIPISEKLTRIGETSPPKFEPRVWGDYSFKVAITWLAGGKAQEEPSEVGGFIKVETWTENAHGRKTLLPVKITWRRRCAGVTFPPLEFAAPLFPITADDIGCSLVAEIVPNIADMGTAFCEVGTFELDASLRSTLQSAMHSGGTSFSVEPSHKVNDDYDQSTLVLTVNPEEIRLETPGLDNVGFVRPRSMPLGSIENPVTIDLNSTSGLILNFPCEDGATTPVAVSSLSRRQRDTIVLMIRAFQALKVTKFALLLEQMAQNTQAKGARPEELVDQSTNTAQSTDLDFYIVFDQLNRQCVQAIEDCEKSSRDRVRATAEKDALEEDMRSTIEVYKQLLMQASQAAAGQTGKANASLHREITSAVELDSSAFSQRATALANMQSQLRETQAQAKKYLEELERKERDNKQLKAKLQEKSDQLKAWIGDDLRGLTEATGETARRGELEEHIRELEKMNLSLKREVGEKKIELKGNRKDGDLADRLEKSLRDIEMLTNRLDQSENERFRLEKDAEYLKRKMEEVNREKLSIATDRVEMSDNVVRLERSKDRQVEVMQLKLKDAEIQLTGMTKSKEILTKEVGQLRKQVETLEKSLVKATKKVEESDTAFAELNRTLMQERTMAETNLKDLHVTMMTRTGTGLSPVRESLGGDRLREQLRVRDEEIERLKAENAELKAKVRKLTVNK